MSKLLFKILLTPSGTALSEELLTRAPKTGALQQPPWLALPHDDIRNLCGTSWFVLWDKLVEPISMSLAIP